MKSLIPKLICALIINAQSLFAHPPAAQYKELSVLEIRSYGGMYITVSVDRQYFQNPVKNFQLSDIYPGDHKIEIYTERIVHHGFYTSTQQVKLFSGIVYVKAGSIVQAIVDEHGKFYIDDVDPLMHYDDHDHAYDHYDPDIHYQQPYAMYEADFQRLLDVLRDQWFDDTRFDVAEQSLKYNRFTSLQVKQIMELFSFEDSRLDFAKAAYTRVIDPQNYFVVYKAFWFSSSIDELNDYISRK